MLKRVEKIMLKILIGGMFVSLVPTRVVFADDIETNNTQTTDAAVSINEGNTTTGAAVSIKKENTTTGAAVNINEGDTTAPVFKSISIDKKSATTGDKITVTVEASDDMSGIDSIGISYNAPSGSSSKYVSLKKNSEGKYTGTITVGLNDAAGVWKVNIISINDNASNKIAIFNTEVTPSVNIDNAIAKDLSAGDFEVNGTIPDTTAPVFKSITLDKRTGTNGEKITITVDAIDDISGVDSIGISYVAPSGSASKYVLLGKNSDGKYTGTITVGQNDAIGIWKVNIISINDNASNKIAIFNTEITPSVNIDNAIAKDLSAGDFEVNGTIPDTTAPVFNNISIDKRNVSKGEKIVIAVDASDDISGIDSIGVSYVAPSGSASKYVSLRKNNEGKYTGTITVGLDDAVGLWKVNIISINDNASNKLAIFNTEITPSVNIDNAIAKDLSTGDFEVNSTVLDPEVKPTPDEPTDEDAMPRAIRILGTERVGETLSAQIRKDGTEFIVDPSKNPIYEWFRLDDEDSETGTLVGRDKTYELTSDDLNKYIKLLVYYNNKKVDEEITSKIIKRRSSSSSSSSSGSSSSSSSSNSSSSSSDSNGTTTSNNNKAYDNGSTADGAAVSNTNSTAIKTVKVETNQEGIIKLVNENGQTVTGWQLVDQKWYLANSTGVAQTGWQQVNDVWYLLDNTGVMQTGWQQVNGVWYLLKVDGAMATGWQQTNGKWYYLYSDGSMASNTIIDGYKVDESGAWV